MSKMSRNIGLNAIFVRRSNQGKDDQNGLGGEGKTV